MEAISNKRRKREENAVRLSAVLLNVATRCAQKYLEREVERQYGNDYVRFFDELCRENGGKQCFAGVLKTLERNGISDKLKNYPSSLRLFDIDACYNIACFSLRVPHILSDSFDTPGGLLNKLRLMRMAFFGQLHFLEVDSDEAYAESVEQLKRIVSGLSVSAAERKLNEEKLTKCLNANVLSDPEFATVRLDLFSKLCSFKSEIALCVRDMHKIRLEYSEPAAKQSVINFDDVTSFAAIVLSILGVLGIFILISFFLHSALL